jgi:hypothetical protein
MAGTGTRKPGNAKAPQAKKATRLQTSTNRKVTVGSKNTTSAKFAKPAPTRKQERVQKAIDKGVLDASRGTAYRNLAREGATKKGGMPVYNSTDANRLRLSKKSPRSNMT